MIEFLFIVIVLGVCALGVYTWRRHHSICSECKANIWAKYKDATPTGPNPLGIYAEVKIEYCKKCGHCRTSSHGYDYR